jgi:hypothetical protein
LDGFEGDILVLSLAGGWLRCLWMSKFQLSNVILEPEESRSPTSMAPKPLLLNHFYIHRIILDGFEGDVLVLSLAGGWFGCFWMSNFQLS